jgi:hypothetical protein
MSGLLLFAACAVSGCGDLIGVCTAELRPNLIVEVRDAVTGEPAARGATGTAEHTGSRIYTDLLSADDLQLYGNWSEEREGRYSVFIRKPGYRHEDAQVTVDGDRCHVKTARIAIRLSRDSAAVEVPPLSFERGARVSGGPGSVGIRVFGDTLVVSGRAVALCGELGIASFRTGAAWHIQLQPTDWTFSCPNIPRLQQFEARFKLAPGPAPVLVTHAAGSPMTFFEGGVSPLNSN